MADIYDYDLFCLDFLSSRSTVTPTATCARVSLRPSLSIALLSKGGTLSAVVLGVALLSERRGRLFIRAVLSRPTSAP